MTDAKVKHTQKEEIGYAWNFQADLGNGRGFSLSGNFPKGLSSEDMSKEVDKVRAVFDRQQAISASRGAEEEVERITMMRAQAAKDLADIDEKYAQKGGMSSAERQQREAAVKHLEKMDADIEYKKGVLAKLKAESQ